MRSRLRRIDLIAFLAVLAAGLGLVLMGVQPEAVTTLAVGLSSLYSAWVGVGRGSDGPTDRARR
jgi:hypothetical protein